MAYSMTGYGSAKSEINGKSIEVQIKTLNNRGLDVHVNMPRQSGGLEIELQKLVPKYIGRGRVDILVILGDDAQGKGVLNTELLEKRADALDAVADFRWFERPADMDRWVYEMCLKQRDIWDCDQGTAPIDDELSEAILTTATEALKKLAEARRVEGEALTAYLLGALDQIDDYRKAAAQRDPERIENYRRQLQERLDALAAQQNFVLDADRIATEVALMADKMDVTEELTRLATHLTAMRALINTPVDSVSCIGKKLDFYLQELNREATTTASKSRDAELTKLTIEIRTIIESIREQTANIQ